MIVFLFSHKGDEGSDVTFVLSQSARHDTLESLTKVCVSVCLSECYCNGSARNKDQKLVGRFFKNWIFYRLLHCCPIENVWEIWPIKIDFGRPNAKIGRKMASGRLLFLALNGCMAHVTYVYCCYTACGQGCIVLHQAAVDHLG